MTTVVNAMRMSAGGFPSAVAAPIFLEGALRMVGPITTLAHALPVRLEPGQLPLDEDVRPHPHIGIAALTYIVSGTMTHSDSLGSAIDYEPGDLGCLLAGRGVTHSERYSRLRRDGGLAETIIVWIALADEDAKPSFTHVRASELPGEKRQDMSLRLLAGQLDGLVSSLLPGSSALVADVELAQGARLPLPDQASERAVYVMSGRLSFDDLNVEAGQTIVLSPGARGRLVAESEARCILFGGEPVGSRYQWWNLVASDIERVDRAKAAWREQRMPLPVGDDREFTPCPPDDGRPLLHLLPASAEA